jgi:hypothetical protein
MSMMLRMVMAVSAMAHHPVVLLLLLLASACHAVHKILPGFWTLAAASRFFAAGVRGGWFYW